MTSTLSIDSNTLAPFHLRQLIRPVFASPPPPPTDEAQSANNTSSGPSKNPVVRSVDGYHSFLWIGSNEGRVKGFDLKPSALNKSRRHPRLPSATPHTSPTAALKSPSPSSSSSSSTPRSLTQPIDGGIDPSCFQDTHLFPTTENARPKPIERLFLIPTISTAVILSEGTVTFHSILDLRPQPLSSFPTIRGVSAVTLDEDAFDTHPTSPPPDELMMCVIKKKTIHLFWLRESGLQHLQELPFASAAFNGLLRCSVLLLADVEQYYLVALNQSADLIPLLPISQSSSPSHEHGRQSPTAAQPSPHHRPSMSAIPYADEFLIASHTGSTCLGVFVSSSGEPSRGTLEWPSNPRSVSVDQNHVLALLFNGTIEIHALATQELLQVITLPSGLDARILSPTKFGVSVPGESFESHLSKLKIILAPDRAEDPTATPSIQSPVSQSFDVYGPVASRSSVLLIGRDSVHALCTRTLLAEVECLMATHRWDEALRLTEERSQNIASPQLTRTSLELAPQLPYIYSKIALHYLSETKFEAVGQLWFRGQGDPRILIRLFPTLRAAVVAAGDEVEVYKGLQPYLSPSRSADELITANLVRNYSPHIQPSVETAASTVDLKSHLSHQAKRMLLSYLRHWKRDRLLKGGANLPDRRLDAVVDTALAELLAERRYVDSEAYTDLKVFLERPHACILQELKTVLENHRCYVLLAEICLKSDDLPKALEVWSRLHDQEWEDPTFDDGLDRIANILQKSAQPELVSRYAIWLAKHDPHLSVRVLVGFESIDVLATLSQLPDHVSELYLEHLLLQPLSRKKGRDESALRTYLILGYLSRLKKDMSPRMVANQPEPSVVSAQFYRLIDRYLATERLHDSFLDYLLRVHAEEEDLTSKPVLTRLKLIVCLDQVGEAYDVLRVRRVLEEMGGSAEMMAYERAIVYAKLGLHRPALSLLAVTLRDLRSSERYCTHAGSLVTPNQARKIVERIGSSSSGSVGTMMIETRSQASTEHLLILLELAIRNESAEALGSLLGRHTSQLALAQTLPLLGTEWPLENIQAYVSRSLRQSTHVRLEAKLLKAVASGQEFGTVERASRLFWIERDDDEKEQQKKKKEEI